MTEVFAAITRLIVKCVDPDRILLFGSMAKGTANLQSDIDLLVVGSFTGPKHRRAPELRGLLDGFAIHIDLHCLTPDELAHESQDGHAWTATLLSTAITLYARTPKMEKTPAR